MKIKLLLKQLLLLFIFAFSVTDMRLDIALYTISSTSAAAQTSDVPFGQLTPILKEEVHLGNLLATVPRVKLRLQRA